MKKPICLIVISLLSVILTACDRQNPQQSQEKERVQQASTSMEPAIKKEEFIDVDKSAYTKARPERWDVVVFIQPERHEPWISRVVGLPGEIIDIKPQGIFINGKRVPLPTRMGSVVHAAKISGSKISFPHTIPADSYFILGDNTTQAYDSRFWGAVPVTSIKGRVVGK